MTRRTVIVATIAVVVVCGLAMVGWQRHTQGQQVAAAATTASADAVLASNRAPLILDRLTRVRTLGFEAVDAAAQAQSQALQSVAVAADHARARRAALARAASAGAAGESSGSRDGASLTDDVPVQRSAPPRPRPSGGLVIGDSVSLGAESCLAPLGYRVDAEVGRQFDVGLSRLRVAAADGLPDTVVIHLGTNGPFSESGFDDVMALTGTQRRVVWVTVHLPAASRYAFADSLNAMIRRLAQPYDNVRIADFDAAADRSPDWLAGDGIHISGAGCQGFTDVIDKAVTDPA